MQDLKSYGLDVLEQLPLSLRDRIATICQRLVDEGVPKEVICEIAKGTATDQAVNWNEIRRRVRNLDSTGLAALERFGLFIVDRAPEAIHIRAAHHSITDFLRDICESD